LAHGGGGALALVFDFAVIVAAIGWVLTRAIELVEKARKRMQPLPPKQTPREAAPPKVPTEWEKADKRARDLWARGTGTRKQK